MTVGSTLRDAKDGKNLEIAEFWKNGRVQDKGERSLVVSDPMKIHGTFKSVESNVAETVTVVEPSLSGSLVLADLIISTERQNGGTVTLQFTDGTDTALIYKVFANDAPVSISTGISGRLQGWKDARVELVNVGNTDCTVLVTYVKVPDAFPFAQWDELR